MKKYIKNILISISFCFLFPQQQIDGILAVVGENIVTQGDFFQQLRQVAEQRSINPKTTPLKYENLAENLLSNIVNQYVFLEHAKKDTNMIVSGEEVQRQLDQQIDMFISQVGSVTALESVFGKSIQGIKADYWDEIYNAMLIEQFRYFLVAGITVGKNEVDNFYLTYKDSLPEMPKRANFSLLNTFFYPSDETITKYFKDVLLIKDSLDVGLKTFEQLVLSHSDDLATKNVKGVVGYTERGSLFKEYEMSAFSANVGDVIGPIKTSAGLHIIKVVDKKGEKINTQHILKKTQPTDEDKRSVVLMFQNIYEKSLSNPLFLENYIENDETENSTGLSGNYLNFFYIENMPEEISSIIESSEESFLFTPLILQDESIALLYVYEKFDRELSSVENSYNYIEGLAKEKKIVDFLDNWLIEAKKEVYINIFVEE